MTRDEALTKADELLAQQPVAAGPSGAIDLSLLRQLLPLLAIIFPPLAPVIPLIEKLLDLLGFQAIPQSVADKLDELLDTLKIAKATP